jgi:hypothetical protein
MADPPFTALGLPGSETFYQPMADPDYSALEEKYVNFQHWVTSYYKHPDIASGKPSGLSSAKRTDKRTINSWSEEEKEKCFDVVAAARSDFPLCVFPISCQENRQKLEPQLCAFDAGCFETEGSPGIVQRGVGLIVLSQYQCSPHLWDGDYLLLHVGVH